MKKERSGVIFSKIGLRLIIPYLIVSFLTLVIITGLIYYNFDVQTKSIQEIQEEISLKASYEINNYAEGIKKELDITSHNIFCVECSDTNKKILKNLIDGDPSIYALSVISKDGKEVTKIARYLLTGSSDLRDVSTQDVYKKAVAEGWYISPVYISEYNIPFISMSLPILDEKNNKIGVLSAEVDLSPMWDTISRITVRETGYVYVVDQNGALIAYKNVNLVKEKFDVKNIHGVENFLNNVRGSETYSSFNNEKVIGTWNSVDITGWGVIVEIPTEEISQDLNPVLLVAGISIVLFILFIAIILIIIFKRLVKPVSYLQQGVANVKSGNLDYKIEVASKDELGELASAFNQMTKDLKASQEQIKGHAEELEQKVKERTKELDERVGELTGTKTAVINMMEDMDTTNKELIETQEELKKSLEELKKLDVKKDEFISIAAHELKTPLTSIHGFAQLLQNKDIAKDVDKRDKYLKIMDTETKRLAKLVSDILDLSRIDLGTIKLGFEEVDTNKFMDDIEKEMNVQIKDHGLESEYEIEKNLPKIDTDKEKLTEIVLNLINNAVKYTPKGKITVKVFSDKENINFSVKDTGIGIAKEHYDKLFHRFYQVDSSYTRKAGGTGLGLALCKEFVTLLGGKIGLKSEPGKGSEFYFSLPIKGAPKTYVREEERKARERLEKSEEVTKRVEKMGIGKS